MYHSNQQTKHLLGEVIESHMPSRSQAFYTSMSAYLYCIYSTSVVSAMLKASDEIYVTTGSVYM